MKCWHAFEHMCVLANGDVACSIRDGRGDFELVRTWGRSRRRKDELLHLSPHLKPATSLPAG